MHAADNTRIVQEAYSAFGRSDIPAVLSLLADDVVWMPVYGAGRHVPHSGVRHGVPAVREFFGQVAEHVNFSRFEPKEFIATGDKVVAIGHYTATTSAKKPFDADFAMVFTVHNGKITRFQEFTDSAALDEAYRVGTAV